jgi:hypothetical protein
MTTNDGQDLSPAGDFNLSPEQASAKLQELTVAYKGVAPETPATAAEAKARLQTLAGDKGFYDRLMRGNQTAKAEFDRLTGLVANSDESPSDYIETVDSVTDPNAQSRAARAALFDGLQAQGFADSAVDYVEGLDRGEIDFRPTEGDGVAAKEILDRLSKSSRWHARIFEEKDPTAIEAMTRLSSVVALAAQDGEAVTPVVEKYIANLMEEHR